MALIKDNDIYISFLIYYGYPEIILSFSSDFRVLIDNKKIGGNLNYVISQQIRTKFNFTGNLYIKI